jgi:hypothetical protein
MRETVTWEKVAERGNYAGGTVEMRQRSTVFTGTVAAITVADGEVTLAFRDLTRQPDEHKFPPEVPPFKLTYVFDAATILPSLYDDGRVDVYLSLLEYCVITPTSVPAS